MGTVIRPSLIAQKAFRFWNEPGLYTSDGLHLVKRGKALACRDRPEPKPRAVIEKGRYRTLSSARRFIARPSGLSFPSGVVFGATGSFSPRPTVVSRSAATPLDTR